MPRQLGRDVGSGSAKLWPGTAPSLSRGAGCVLGHTHEGCHCHRGMPGEGSPCAGSQEAQGARGWNSQHRTRTDGEEFCTPLRAGSSVPEALGTRGWLEAVSQQLCFSQPTAGAPPLVAAGTNGWDSRSSAVLGPGRALGESCRDRTQPAGTRRALPEVTARLGSSHKLKPSWEQLSPLAYTLSPHCLVSRTHHAQDHEGP